MLAPVRVVPSDLAQYSGRITPAVLVQVRHENSDVREQERYRKSDLRHFCRTCKGGCWKKQVLVA